jgi:hypothetical protein
MKRGNSPAVDSLHEVRQCHTEGLGNTLERVEYRRMGCLLQSLDRHAVNASLRSQSFLTESPLLAKGDDSRRDSRWPKAWLHECRSHRRLVKEFEAGWTIADIK